MENHSLSRDVCQGIKGSGQQSQGLGYLSMQSRGRGVKGEASSMLGKAGLENGATGLGSTGFFPSPTKALVVGRTLAPLRQLAGEAVLTGNSRGDKRLWNKSFPCGPLLPAGK